MSSRFTEEDLRAFQEDNAVTVEMEHKYAVYSYELNRACTPEQLVASLRLFADEIEQAIR
jgi:c-di-GMP-binding flagellar brake protein YcgR